MALARSSARECSRLRDQNAQSATASQAVSALSVFVRQVWRKFILSFDRLPIELTVHPLATAIASIHHRWLNRERTMSDNMAAIFSKRFDDYKAERTAETAKLDALPSTFYKIYRPIYEAFEGSVKAQGLVPHIEMHDLRNG